MTHRRPAPAAALEPPAFFAWLRRAWPARLRRRGRLRHVGRHPLQDSYAGRGAERPRVLADDLARAAHEDAAAVLARLHAHPEGLTAREAAARLARHGANAVEHDRPLGPMAHLLRCYANPFNLLLTVLAAISGATGDLRGTAVIAVMVVLSTGVRFVQEGRSNRAAERLKAMVGNTATVRRRDAGGTATESEVPIRRIVPGDVVCLAAGDMVPADARLLRSRSLHVAQAALTGESVPVEKSDGTAGAGIAPMDSPNLVFMGTSVVSGSATALVVATGDRTAFGAVAARVGRADTEPDAFQIGVNHVSWLLIRFAAVMVPVVLLVNGFVRGDWLQACLFTLSVAVGLTPEMLPMIVTTTLAKGAVALARRKVVVKRLDAIQTLGAMDVLCTDKTGTLTQDRIVLDRHVDPDGLPSDEVLALAFLNSHYQTGLRNLLDRAVLEHVDVAAELRLEHDWTKLDELPFDFERRRMSVVVADRGGVATLICKGALEEVLACCTRVRSGSGADAVELPLDDERRARVERVARALNDEGLRVVAVAVRHLPADGPRCSVADESDLTLMGHVAFLDPPKETAAPALRALAGHGVRVLVLTGDNERVAARVCAQVGLEAGHVVLGPALDALDDAALDVELGRGGVFAKLTPLHKERIVRRLRAQGHVVGFLGDGINDAPALRAADVGLSVDSAVDIAKEAADIILLEKSLMVLDEGVLEGRTTFANLLKYIRMAASSNFGNVLSVLVASVALPFLPMLPLQLLTQNLLYDVAQTAIPFDRVEADGIAHPLRWDAAAIGRFMRVFGPVSSVFDLVTFAVMVFGFGAGSVARQSLFQSGWFVVGLLTQTLVVHLIRAPGLPWRHGQAAPALWATTLAVAAVGLWLPMGPLAPALHFEPLPPAYFAVLPLILLGYAVAATVVKTLYVRRHGWP